MIDTEQLEAKAKEIAETRIQNYGSPKFIEEELIKLFQEQYVETAKIKKEQENMTVNYENWMKEKEDRLTSVLKEFNDLKELINTPELDDYIKGFKIEATHQTQRWGQAEEESKPPHHYVMVMAKLLGKLTVAVWDQDVDKFKHHCITISASLYNCHRQIEKTGTVVHGWFKKQTHEKAKTPKTEA